MESNIKKIKAREIIDSRGNPTLEAEVFFRIRIQRKGSCSIWSINWL